MAVNESSRSDKGRSGTKTFGSGIGIESKSELGQLFEGNFYIVGFLESGYGR